MALNRSFAFAPYNIGDGKRTSEGTNHNLCRLQSGAIATRPSSARIGGMNLLVANRIDHSSLNRPPSRTNMPQ